jgi:hypothetical protein
LLYPLRTSLLFSWDDRQLLDEKFCWAVRWWTEETLTVEREKNMKMD